MPKKKVDKWVIMKKIVELGGKGEEITIYNMTKKLREIGLDVEEETVRRCIKELKWLDILKLKEETLGKTGKPKKVYELACPVVFAKEMIDTAKNTESSTFFGYFFEPIFSINGEKPKDLDALFKQKIPKNELRKLALYRLIILSRLMSEKTAERIKDMDSEEFNKIYGGLVILPFALPIFRSIFRVFSETLMDELKERGIDLNELKCKLSEEQYRMLEEKPNRLETAIFLMSLPEMTKIDENLNEDDMLFIRLIDVFNEDVYPFTILRNIKSNENLILTIKLMDFVMGFVFVELDGNSATILCLKATPSLPVDFKDVVMEILWRNLKTRLEFMNIKRVRAFAYPDTQLAKFYEEVGFRKIAEKYMVFGKTSLATHRCDISDTELIYVIGLTTSYSDNAIRMLEYEYTLPS